MDISTQFMGLQLPNPLIVSSSNLTDKIEGVRKAADAGAGAVVLKSLFEEDIAAGVAKTRSQALEMDPEAQAYMAQAGMLLEPDGYLELVESSVRELDIPVIASLNCYSSEWWIDYAERIENVGAHAIELNLSPMALEVRTDGSAIEKKILQMVKLARKTVKLPLAVKIGPNFSALPHLAKKLQDAGASSLTLFNRFFKMDVNINDMSFKAGKSLSSPEEFGPVLRWVGILSGLTDLEIAASTGINTAADVIKVLLVGGDAAQLCSVLYRDGLDSLSVIRQGIEEWMASHDMNTIQDFKGRMALKEKQRNSHYQRLQYVKAFRG